MTEKEKIKIGLDPNSDSLISGHQLVELLVKEMTKSFKKKGYFPEEESLYVTRVSGEGRFQYYYRIGLKDVQGDLVNLNINNSLSLRDIWFKNDKSVYKTAKDEVPGFKGFVKQVKKLLKDMGRYRDPAEKEDIGL